MGQRWSPTSVRTGTVEREEASTSASSSQTGKPRPKSLWPSGERSASRTATGWMCLMGLSVFSMVRSATIRVSTNSLKSYLHLLTTCAGSRATRSSCQPRRKVIRIVRGLSQETCQPLLSQPFVNQTSPLKDFSGKVETGSEKAIGQADVVIISTQESSSESRRKGWSCVPGI